MGAPSGIIFWLGYGLCWCVTGVQNSFLALCCLAYSYMNVLPSVVHGYQLNMYADDMLCFQHNVIYKVIWILLSFGWGLTSCVSVWRNLMYFWSVLDRNYGTLIRVLLLTVDSFLRYHLLNILVSILMRIWPGRSILDMFMRGCSLDCIVSIVCVLHLVNCWANCIVLLSFQYWTIVMLCGHLCLYSILKDLNVFI